MVLFFSVLFFASINDMVFIDQLFRMQLIWLVP